MAKKLNARIILQTSKPPKNKKGKQKSDNGRPIKQKDKAEQQVEDTKSARELAVQNAKKQGASLKEQLRIAGKTKATIPKPKGKAASTGAKIKKGGSSRSKKSTKKTTTTTKKVVAKKKPRTYSTNPEAIRSRERRAKAKKEAEAKASVREGNAKRPTNPSRKKRK